MMFAASVKLLTNSMYSRICTRMRSSSCFLYAASSVATYGRMSSMRDWTKIWHEKSSEFRKFWNCTMNAVCSSSLLSAKLMDEARSIARKRPSLSTTMPSRTSATGTKSCVDLFWERMFRIWAYYFTSASRASECRCSATPSLIRETSAVPAAIFSWISKDHERSCSLLSESFGTYTSAALARDGFHGRSFFLLHFVVPKVKFRTKKEVKRAFKTKDEWPAVKLKKGECRSKACDDQS
jgi:hypothetical protein